MVGDDRSGRCADLAEAGVEGAPSAAEAALAALGGPLPEATAGRVPATDGDRRFVVALAAAFAAGAAPAETAARLAAAGISSWAAVERLLRLHGCSSFAHGVLDRPEVRAACLPPTDLIERLHRHYLGAFAWNATHPPRLGRLLTRFADAGVPVLVIKGLTLGHWLYDDPAHREYLDFDFVVPEAKAREVHALLTDLGYTCPINPFLRPPLHADQTLEAATYQHRNEITIDLRFNPWRDYWRPIRHGDPFDRWWERRQDLAITGLAVPTFGPEDQFLQLARHLQEHDYARAIWFVDVMLLLRRFGADLDWALVGREARRHGIHGGIYRTLEVLDRVYGFRAPDPAWRRLRPSPLVRRLHRRAWPEGLALKSERPNLLKNPMGPHHVSLGALRERRQAAGLALLLLDRNRSRTATHLLRQRFPSGAWLRTVYGDAGGDASYLALWRRHQRHHRPDRTD